MAQLLTELVDHFATGGDAPCWRYKTEAGWQTLSWTEVGDKAFRLAGWLVAQGLHPGDRVALWATTRWEWSLIDIAVLMAGGVSVPIYNTLPLDQAHLILKEPQCRFLFLEPPAEASALARVEKEVPTLDGVIMIEGQGATDQLPVWELAQILAGPEEARDAVTQRIAARQGTELASIVYTSGTTGRPKGVELTLDNFHAEVQGLREVMPFTPGTECLMFLPLAHIVARAMQFFQLDRRFVAAYGESLEKLGDNIRETRPHFFVGVPRVFEKIEARLKHQVAELPPLKQRLFRWALQVGEVVARYQQQHQAVPLMWRLRWKGAQAIVRPVHHKMGGRLRCVISGGAPLSAEVAKFFASLGLLIIEGYGLTETCAAVTINRLDDYRFGTVGKALQGVNIRMADDGEILVKGPMVFQGYFLRPEDTKAVLDADHWFHTGDIGEFTRDGFLRITDRKKDLIKTSGGKYIAPQPIEYQLKASPFINDVMVHGDRQKYLTALITLDQIAVQRLLDREGVVWSDWETAVRHPRVVRLVQEAVDTVNSGLARWETIKRFHVLEQEFAIESGELTPTMKIRRAVAYQRYREYFEQMYQDAS